MAEDTVTKDNVYFLAEWLRSKDSHVETSDGVALQFGKRVELFYGKHVLKAINDANIKKFPQIKDYADASQEELFTALNEMLERSYFKRVEPVEVKKKRFDAEHATRVNLYPEQSFDADGMYMWIMERNEKWALAKAMGIVTIVITICCFKIWPIWLRIFSWWLSLLVLVSLLTMIVLHVISGPIFFLIGMRGTYFMPNLFDEEIFFIDTFSPLFGRGGEHQARWKEERELQLRIKNAKKAAAEGKAVEAVPTEVQGSIWTSWQMAVLNAIIFVIVGGIVGYYSGLFSPENVPEFVISPKEMYQIFPSLAPPTADVSVDDAEEIDLE